MWAQKRQKKGYGLSDEIIREKAAFFAASVGGDDNNPATNPSWVQKFKRRHSSAVIPRKNSLAQDELDTGAVPVSLSPKSPDSVLSLSSPDLHDAKSRESLRVASPGNFSNIGKSPRPVHSHSTGSLSNAATDVLPTSFSPLLRSDDSACYSSPAPAAGSSSVLEKLQRPLASAMDHNAQRPRSQSFPTLDQSMSPSTLAGMLDSPMEDYDSYLESPDDDQHLETSTKDRPRTVSPSDTMRAPPLPSSVRHYKTESPSIESRLASTLSSPQSPPSHGDARRALELVVKYLEQQPTGYLDLQESVLIGKLIEKLKIQH